MVICVTQIEGRLFFEMLKNRKLRNLDFSMEIGFYELPNHIS